MSRLQTAQKPTLPVSFDPLIFRSHVHLNAFLRPHFELSSAFQRLLNSTELYHGQSLFSDFLSLLLFLQEASRVAKNLLPLSDLSPPVQLLLLESSKNLE